MRCRAGIEQSKILETTTNLQFFDLAYDAILAGYTEEEGVWWTTPPRSFPGAADTLSSRGIRRLQRAVVDGCLPIVERLLELGYYVGSTHSLKASEDVTRDLANYLIYNNRARDIRLLNVVQFGNYKLIKYVFRGRLGNRKYVRKSIEIALQQRNLEMLNVLTSDKCSGGEFGQETLEAGS
jgi:hypothetical protein